MIDAERKQAEEALKRSEKELNIRNQINTIFLTHPDETMYAEVLTVILEVMESKFGTFGYFAENGSFVAPAVTREAYWEKCNVPGKEIIYEKGTFGGIWGRAIKEKKTFIVNDGPLNTPKGHIPIENTIATPIIYQNEIISAIHLANKPNGYDEEDKEMLETIANQIASVLYARLQRDKHDKERKQAEENLEKELRLRETLLDNIPDCVALILKKGTREIVASNRLAREIGAVPGQTCYRTSAGRDDDCPFCLAPKLWKTGQLQRLEVEYRGTWYEGIWAPLSEDQYVHYIFDITERKRAENELKFSAERFERWKASSFIGIIQSNAKGGINDANDTLLTMLGYSRQDLLEGNLDWTKLTPPEFLHLDKKAMEEAADKGFWTPFEKEYFHKNGHRIPIIIGGSVFKEFPDDYIVFIIDITERKRAEEALRESEKRYRSLVELSPEAIIVHQDWKIVYINPEGTKMFGGMNSDEIIGNSLYDFIPPEYHEIIKARTEQIYEERKTQSEIELKVLRPDKEEIDVLETGTSIDYMGQPAALGVIRDITERKLTEEALQAGEERYRRLIELNPDSIYVFREGKILYVNQATINMMGAKGKEELIGKKIFDLIHPDYREKAKHRARLAMEKGEVSPLMDFIFLRLDGEEIYIQAMAAPVVYEGEPAILSAIRDVTEQKRAEAEKAKLEAQLQQSQKLEAIGTLAGGIAHDFNNILTPFIIHTEMALMSIPEDSPVRHNLKEALTAGHRARDLVKQILTFSRQREQKRKPLRVSLVLKETLKLLRASLPTTIEIKQNVEAERDWVVTAPTYIHQVLMNLCTNAAHAMGDKGGTLDIRLEDIRLDSDDMIQYPDLKSGTYARLTVADTGHGMGSVTRERIFEPYFTTKEKEEGTGLGLSVVHGIVKDLGGEITVDSELGKGSTFKVLFPTIENEISEETEHISEIPEGSEHILYVDDEMPMVETVQEMLEQLGYIVTTRTSSIEALELFREKSDSFDLIITDQTMPNMTGDELVKEILQIRPEMPIILCTGFSDKIDEIRAKDIGIRAFIMKPIVMSEISNTIRMILDN